MNLRLRNKLRSIFNKHDPIKIYFGKKVNFDEYDPEINRVLIRFNRSRSLQDFTDELHIVFQQMFDNKIAGQKSRYKKLAKEVYTLLHKELKRKA